MVAAETFPLAGAMPDVPPVNFAYNAAYLLRPRDPAAAESGPKTPTYSAVAEALKPCLDVYGRDFDDPEQRGERGDREDAVHPAHERAVGDQRFDATNRPCHGKSARGRTRPASAEGTAPRPGRGRPAGTNR